MKTDFLLFILTTIVEILAMISTFKAILKITQFPHHKSTKNQQSQNKETVSEHAMPAPVKKPVTAEQVLKRSASINISKQYQTDAIAMIKVIEQFPSKNKFIHSAIMFNEKIIEVSTSKYQPFATKEIKLQQLNDVIQVLRQAINHKIPSIQIAYNFDGIKNYIDDLPKNNATALSYVQELNDLAQHINIVFVSEGLSDLDTFSKLSTYLSKNLKDPTITKNHTYRW